MHLKLREAGVDADLIVFEGLSHAQYHMNPDIPETRFHFLELARFFSTHLKEHWIEAWQKRRTCHIGYEDGTISKAKSGILS